MVVLFFSKTVKKEQTTDLVHFFTGLEIDPVPNPTKPMGTGTKFSRYSLRASSVTALHQLSSQLQ